MIIESLSWKYQNENWVDADGPMVRFSLLSFWSGAVMPAVVVGD